MNWYLEKKNILQKDICTAKFIATLCNSQDMQATSVSINRGIEKEDVVHIYNGILLSHKNEIEAICSNMDGPIDDHTKCGKSSKERQISCDSTYV